MNLIRTVENLFARLIRYSSISGTSPDGYDQVRGWDADESYQIPVRRLQWYGFRSRPPVNSEAVFLANNGSRGDKVLVAADNIRFGPTDQADEEVEVYSSKGQRIRLTEDGNLTATGGGGCGIFLQNRVVDIFDGQGAIIVLQNDRVSIDAETATPRVYFSGAAPVAVTTNPNVVSAVVNAGNDSVFKMTLVAGPMAPAVGVLCTITYAKSWASAPIASIATSEKVTASTTATTITLNATSLPVGSYDFVITSFGII